MPSTQGSKYKFGYSVLISFILVFILLVSWGETVYADYQQTLQTVGQATSEGIGSYLGAAPSSLILGVSVGFFNKQQNSSLSELLEALYSPNSPIYHRFLTPQQFASLYAPSPQIYAQAVGYFISNGLKVYTNPTRLYLNLVGTVGQLESAFHTSVGLFRNGNLTFYANTQPLLLPYSFSDYVTSVVGFENYTFFVPDLAVASINQTQGANVPPSQPPYHPATIQAAYNATGLINEGFNGTGETIVLVDAGGDPTLEADVAEFSATYGLPVPIVNITLVNGSVQDVVNDPEGTLVARIPAEWDLETALDVEWAHAMAPGAKLVDMVSPDQGPGLVEAIAEAITLHLGNVVSQSFGLWEGYANESSNPYNLDVGTESFIEYINPFYEMAAATGITVLASSGDSGSTATGGPAPSVNFPASDPWVTAVGGTTLVASEQRGWESETAWGGSGGGFSVIFKRPSYQSGFGVPLNATGRGVPDVAADANPDTGVVVVLYGVNLGFALLIGGTSLASPLWAGVTALIDDANHTDLGFLNPLLYTILNSEDYPVEFHEIVSGSNGNYTAHPGWNPVTGIGSPNVGYLVHPSHTTTTNTSGGLTITYPLNGEKITSATLTVNGTASLPPGNWLIGKPNSAPAFLTGEQQNQLNILSAWIGDYRPGYFNVYINVTNLTNILLPPPPSEGEWWVFEWSYADNTYFAAMVLNLAGVNASSSDVGISFEYGTITSQAGTNSYNIVGEVNGSYTPTAPGTITITVPTSDVGDPTRGALFTKLTAQTLEVVGTPIAAALETVDTVGGSTSYILGQPLLPAGYVQVSLNPSFSGAVNATLLGYPLSQEWKATLSLSGLQSGNYTVFARQVVNGVPQGVATVKFEFTGATATGPHPGITLETNARAYSSGQTVHISGVLLNSSLRPIIGATVGLEVTGPYGEPVFVDEAYTNTQGEFSDTFTLPSDASVGYYTVYAASNSYEGITQFVVDNAPPTLTNVVVKPQYGDPNTTFNVSAVSTDDVAVYSVYATIISPRGLVVLNLSMNLVGDDVYAATFRLNSSDPFGVYRVIVNSVDVAGRTTSSSVSFTFTPFPLVITSLQILSPSGKPVNSFTAGQTVEANATVFNADPKPVSALILVEYISSNGEPVFIGGVNVTIAPGAYASVEVGTTVQGSGGYTVRVFAWNGFVAQKGEYWSALAQPVGAQFSVS